MQVIQHREVQIGHSGQCHLAGGVRHDRRDEEANLLVTELHRRSPEFAELWDGHDVEARRDEQKRIVHPALGVLEVNCLNLFSEDGRQRLLWFTPTVGTDTVEKLELLSVVGTQDLTPE